DDRPPVKQGKPGRVPLRREHRRRRAGRGATSVDDGTGTACRHLGAGDRRDDDLPRAERLPAHRRRHQARSSRPPEARDSQAMEALDGWVMPSDAGIDLWWEAFAGLIDRPELLEPPFAERETR